MSNEVKSQLFIRTILSPELNIDALTGQGALVNRIKNLKLKDRAALLAELQWISSRFEKNKCLYPQDLREKGLSVLLVGSDEPLKVRTLWERICIFFNRLLGRWVSSTSILNNLHKVRHDLIDIQGLRPSPHAITLEEIELQLNYKKQANILELAEFNKNEKLQEALKKIDNINEKLDSLTASDKINYDDLINEFKNYIIFLKNGTPHFDRKSDVVHAIRAMHNLSEIFSLFVGGSLAQLGNVVTQRKPSLQSVIKNDEILVPFYHVISQPSGEQIAFAMDKVFVPLMKKHLQKVHDKLQCALRDANSEKEYLKSDIEVLTKRLKRVEKIKQSRHERTAFSILQSYDYALACVQTLLSQKDLPLTELHQSAIAIHKLICNKASINVLFNEDNWTPLADCFSGIVSLFNSTITKPLYDTIYPRIYKECLPVAVYDRLILFNYSMQNEKGIRALFNDYLTYLQVVLEVNKRKLSHISGI